MGVGGGGVSVCFGSRVVISLWLLVRCGVGYLGGLFGCVCSGEVVSV